MYKPYFKPENYHGTVIDVDELEHSLRTASRNIDTVTFNRIVAKGFENLTRFQQDVIREATVRLAEFVYTNKADLESITGGYSINGVSVSYGNAPGMAYVNGVTMPAEIYDLIAQTGLCCQIAR